MSAVDEIDELAAAPSSTADPPSERGEPAPNRLRRRGTIALAIGVGAWLLSLIGLDLRSMTDVGLVSILPAEFYVAVAVLVIGYLIVADRAPDATTLLGGYLVAIAAVVHATPALLSGNVPYRWSWDHLAIVDLVQRTGGVDVDRRFLEVHHGWPGFYAATAMLSDASGVDARTLALWAPLTFTLVALLALSILFGSIVDDPRVVWLGLLVYVFANWVGQEYFSSQGFAFALYLSVLAIVVPSGRPPEAVPESVERAGSVLGDIVAAVRTVSARNVLAVFVVVAIVSSHLLTAIMLVVTLGTLALVRAGRTGWLAVTTLAAIVVWMIGPARPYLVANGFDGATDLSSQVPSSITSLGRGIDFSDGRLVGLVADRFLTNAVVVLAVVGVARRRMRGRPIAPIVGGAVAPVVLLVAGGGDVLLRAYLFATPWLALGAALALAGRPKRPASGSLLAARVAVLGVLVASFLFADMGRLRSNLFTDDEVRLVSELYDSAPPDSLLVTGTRNYPGSSLDDEQFFHVAIDHESPALQARIAADPDGVLGGWLSDQRYAATYLLITRSQKLGEIDAGTMPIGILDDIELALRRSPDVDVVLENDDAVVFSVSQRRSGTEVKEPARG